LLAGLMQPLGGGVLFEGRPLAAFNRRELARKLAVIFQDFSSPYDFTVFDIVAMGRTPYLARWKPLSARDREVIASSMQMTETQDLAGRSFLELSGGERQRVIIAKALAQEPSVLLLDEPATHLDIHHQVALFEVLRRLNRQCGVTILCITHDLTLGAQYMDRFLLLKSGRLLGDGPPDKIMRKKRIEDVFHTPVAVGVLPEMGTPYIYPLRSIEDK
jgi:iron complex transport system ATP-binding protein